MNIDQVFQLCNAIALIAWIILIALPSWNRSDLFLTGVIVTLFGIIYSYLIFSAFSFDDMQKFGSIAGLQELFQNKTMVLAGWVHYLAFDLMTGIFIRKNARLHNINYSFTVPCLIFTFMLGPAGLLLYFLFRWIITRNFFADNYN
jgi:Domain of unknown function (DUF4281)